MGRTCNRIPAGQHPAQISWDSRSQSSQWWLIVTFSHVDWLLTWAYHKNGHFCPIKLTGYWQQLSMDDFSTCPLGVLLNNSHMGYSLEIHLYENRSWKVKKWFNPSCCNVSCGGPLSRSRLLQLLYPRASIQYSANMNEWWTIFSYHPLYSRESDQRTRSRTDLGTIFTKQTSSTDVHIQPDFDVCAENLFMVDTTIMGLVLVRLHVPCTCNCHASIQYACTMKFTLGAGAWSHLWMNSVPKYKSLQPLIMYQSELATLLYSNTRV